MMNHKSSNNIEFGINAKSFCNYYMDYWRAGMFSDSLRLIRLKFMTCNFSHTIRSPWDYDNEFIGTHKTSF